MYTLYVIVFLCSQASPKESSKPCDQPLTPSAVLKQELLDKSEVELANFHRLDASFNEFDQSFSAVSLSSAGK